MGLFKKNEVDKWDAEIGKRIRLARENAKMTQAQLADAVYKSQGNISDYEAGQHRISAIDLSLIASATDVPVDSLIPGPPYNPRQVKELRPKERRFFHFVRKIGDEDRENKVLDLLIQQARHLVEVIIDADVDAYAAQVEEELREKVNKPKGKK